MRFKAILFLIILLGLFENGNVVSAAGETERIKFNLTVISESPLPEMLSKTTIDGPAGTDFDVDLNTEGFDMKSRFVTDINANDELFVRVNLETRRYFGESPNGLPLFEEDTQNDTLVVGLNEVVVLLPFGRNGGGKTLKIQITPERYSVAADRPDAGQLKIDFPERLSSGEIAIRARKVPHRYQIESKILFEGKEIARGNGFGFIEEFTKVPLRLSESAPESIRGREFIANVAVEGFTTNRPMDLVSISFGITDASGTKIVGGKGINGLGREFRYGLEEELGKGFELVIRVTEKKQ
ncbi:MAG: hypothetical protein OEQ28_10840 [Acidobacteriota bacterium]|nr:hypothetical protein [Acidobacteriota bacterium]